MGREEGGRVATPGGDDVLIWPAPQSRKPANDSIPNCRRRVMRGQTLIEHAPTGNAVG